MAPDPSTRARPHLHPNERKRDCNAGNCEETEQRLARGTQPRDCQWGSWGNCNCTPSTTDASNAGTQSRSQAVSAGCGGASCTGSPSRPCTVAANNCPVAPVCGDCNCTPSIFDDATDGTCSNGGAACTVPGGGCPVCGTCRCTRETDDSASAGVCRDGTTACTVSSGDCTVSCGADWPSTPTETRPGGWDCFGSGSEGGNYCPWGVDVYRRDCAAGCNDGDCSEVKAGPRKVTGRCLSNSPRCGPP